MTFLRSLLLGFCAAALVSAAPRLRLSDTTIGPVSIAPGSNGPLRSVEASNFGDGALNLSLTSSAPWAAPALGAPHPCTVVGGSCLPINVQLNTASLAAGTYTARVTVTDPQAIDAPQDIVVTVIIGSAVPSSANLFVSTQAGSSDTSPFTVNSLIQGSANTTSGGDWLSLAFEGNGSFAFVLPYSVKATNPGGLAPGAYNGSLTVRNSALALDNQAVAVTMNVTESPILSLSSRSLQMRAAVGAPAQIVNLVATNRGLGALALTEPAVSTSNGGEWLTAQLLPNTSIVQVRALAGSLSPGTYTGTVTVNSNGVQGPQQLPVTFEVIARGAPYAAPGGVVNNATFAGNDPLARGVIAAVFGEQFLFTDPVAASSLPLQSSLGGVRVLVNEEPAPVYYSSYGQINFQVPYTAAPGLGTVVVESGGQRSNRVSINIAERAPRLLRLGVGEYGIIVNQDGTFPIPRNTALGGAGRPARAGEALVIYAIGLGPTIPTVASGAGSPTNPLAVVDPRPTLRVLSQGTVLTPFFVGLTPNFVGLYQINVTIPDTIRPGSRIPLSLNMGGSIASNAVEIAIE